MFDWPIGYDPMLCTLPLYGASSHIPPHTILLCSLSHSSPHSFPILCTCTAALLTCSHSSPSFPANQLTLPIPCTHHHIHHPILLTDITLTPSILTPHYYLYFHPFFATHNTDFFIHLNVQINRFIQKGRRRRIESKEGGVKTQRDCFLFSSSPTPSKEGPNLTIFLFFFTFL